MTPTERARERARASRAANLERARENSRRWYAANQERAREQNRAWRAANRDKIAAQKKDLRSGNADKLRAASLAWYRANPERARESMERARVKRLAAPVCEHPACLALGPVHLALQVNPPTCWICGTPVRMGDNLHVDHVVPLARGGIHCADNLRPACGPCNLRKGARVAA